MKVQSKTDVDRICKYILNQPETKMNFEPIN